MYSHVNGQPWTTKAHLSCPTPVIEVGRTTKPLHPLRRCPPMDTLQAEAGTKYLTREEGAIPVRTKEWPEIVRFLGAAPALESARQLHASEGLSLHQAARRVGVHITMLKGWLQATRAAPAAGRWRSVPSHRAAAFRHIPPVSAGLGCSAVRRPGAPSVPLTPAATSPACSRPIQFRTQPPTRLWPAREEPTQARCQCRRGRARGRHSRRWLLR